MELQRGFPLLLQQHQGLFMKNLILAWRNKRSTSLQILSPLFFMFLMFCIQKLTPPTQAVVDPEALVSPPIPPCEHKFSIKRPCFDFVWSGNESQRIGSIVTRMMENNPGRPIPSHKVKSFRTSNEVDEWLFNDPMRCPAAMHFVERNATMISYGIQTNSTKITMRNHAEDSTFKFQIPLQIAAEREIVRSLTRDSSFSWVVGLKEFPHPAEETSQNRKGHVVNDYGSTFFLAVAMFAFVFQMSSLVSEKELKLRQAMTMMGLYDTAYWLSWFTWEGLLALLSSLLTLLSGMMFQFDFFLHNSFAVVFLLFFLFQINMIGFAFMLSAFLSKSSSATTVGFLIFIISFILQIAEGILPLLSRKKRIIWFLFPPNLFNHALKSLSDATSTPEAAGISWSDRAKCAPNEMTCFIIINDILIRLASTFFLWFALAIYFDNIFPNSSGVRKPVFYFLNLGYWTNKDENNVEDSSICSCTSLVPPSEHVRPDDKDVLEEENIVIKQAREGVVDPNVAVQIRGLVKTYPGKKKISCCFCRRRRTPSYRAVKGLWVNFEKDQLFCLLGPNGAGKTTSVSCLTGITPVTSGDALIYGYSVRSSIGMSNIRRFIGVCPQFDILWDALSGQEHLHLFACIKGLPPDSIKMVATKSLAQVKLTEAAKMRASSYSGGMKRRLSVAIALIGDPKLVILDEPTTGMDPITRRHVWDIIEDAKKGRAIILTTHSMEEADILSDRIGIMAKGRLRCIGTSIRLKSRFGTGFIANISFFGGTNGTPAEEDDVSTRHRASVKQFFKSSLNVVPKEESKSFLTFSIPHDEEGVMTKFFAELEDRKSEFGIADIQLSLTTLEEVFLNIARQAEFESAAAEGNLATLTLSSGASIRVPVGARFIGVPGTESTDNPKGVMVEVYWEQDDSGNLCISGHSDDIPVPPNVQLTTASTPTASDKNVFGQRGAIHALVIDPSQIDASNFERYGH